MLGAADLRAAELQEEFNGPVAYDDRWVWFALLALAAVTLYFVAVLWFTREHDRPEVVAWRRPDGPSVRQQYLDRIARIDGHVRSGDLAPRDGHQQLSDAIRSYVETITPLPARTMALADFRRHAPPQLVDAIELMYPPEFAPDDVGEAQQRFEEAVLRARYLVTSWS
ncbi:hypothetical protein [Nocardioides stalactiti]|uniref:hypothetical protein n=1 Tax=Nocardioides stalactiti TaxID=2755356 RepID=UPI001603AAD5|nr:hypothetical protein [Nocardioides stalactiti]